MTYITYVKPQYSDYKKARRIVSYYGSDEKRGPWGRSEHMYPYCEPPKKMPLVLPKPNFIPGYLVRISDMKTVQGSEVHEGYCALSYSWNQSGEIIKDETTGNNYRRVDEGKHKVVFPARTVRKKPRGRKRIPRKVKYVKFEALLQEIGKDFNIRYIWYDKMCINQGDEEKKHCEIHQMHKIYSNAYCTIALVPELEIVTSKKKIGNRVSIDDQNIRTLLSCQWMKRMWTLEEALMSSKMLLVGRNYHRWWYRLGWYDHPIFHKEFLNNAASILYNAHTRTSTKEHDHIFALANIFPDIMKEIIIDYKQDVHELMLQFYGLLAKKDLTILCFRAHDYVKRVHKKSLNNATSDKNEKEAGYEVSIQKFDLPSWTGVYGEHIAQKGLKTSFKNYTVNGRSLQVTCNGMTNHQHLTEISAVAAFTHDDIPPLPQKRMMRWILILLVRLPGSTNGRPIHILGPIGAEHKLHDAHEHIVENLRNLSHFMPIEIKDLQWIDTRSKLRIVDLHFSGLTERLEDFSQYTLLTGIQFTNSIYGFRPSYYPVIKKEGVYYKAIGVCRIKHGEQFSNDIRLEEQMYEIH